MYEELLDKIELTNKELNVEKSRLINSKEYLLGSRILRMLDIKNFHYNIKQSIIKRRVLKLSNAPEKMFYRKERIDNKKKVIVYSCITGGYDSLNEPIIKPCEYVMFSDKIEQIATSWEIESIPNKLKKLSNRMICRYIKLHPFDFFNNYDYVIWIDGNIKTISDVRRLCNIASKSKVGMAIHKHSLRNCAYKEAESCKIIGRGRKKDIDNQICEYEISGFPHEFGLYETGVLVYDMKNENLKHLLDNWYEEIENNKNARDQIALPYVIWKNHYKYDDVGILGNDIWSNPIFRFVSKTQHKG